MSGDDDDKPTVVLDLNALKKQKLKQEEDLANIVKELEFSVGPEEKQESSPKLTTYAGNEDTEDFAEQFLLQRSEAAAQKPALEKAGTRVILFDFQSDFFQKSEQRFPKGFAYLIARTLPELNKCLSSKQLQIVVFNYDVNPKAVNQLTAQIKMKFPFTKTVIMAKNISPEKAKIHAKTPSGANGYYQLPLDPKKIELEFQKLSQAIKKAS